MRTRLLYLASVACVASVGCGPVDTENGELERVGEAVEGLTVDQAAMNGGCSTVVVKKLAEQIVAQADCLSPGAFVELPAQPNASFAASVFPYLEQPARDSLVKALASKPNLTMSINSMLRTVAQQYLLYRWYQDGLCGITLAASPGTSPHETGLAVDLDEYSAWQTALEANGFKWHGAGDLVHYDYVGPGAVDHKGTDVQAFQILWNLNNPGDKIAEDGQWGPMTQARLQKSPADGFAIGPSCMMPMMDADLVPAITIVGAKDEFADHSSQHVSDAFEGQSYTVQLSVLNKGSVAAKSVELGLEVLEKALVGTDYKIESDAAKAGTFVEDASNKDAANPSHGTPPPASFALKVGDLAPMETKRVTLNVDAKTYSIVASGAQPTARFWVKDAAGIYHQDKFGDDPTMSSGQTFGPHLEAALPVDVYSHSEWDFDTDREEGWTAEGDTQVLSSVDDQALLFTSSKMPPSLLSPKTSYSATDLDAIDLRIARSGGTGAGWLYFTTSAEPAFGADKRLSLLTIPDDGKFHELHLDARAHAKFTGTITRFRLVPYESGEGSGAVDFLRAVKGKPVPPGGGISQEPPQDSGCGCSDAGKPGSSSDLAAALSLGALAMLLKRTRRAKVASNKH
jgi:hypothetical protein